MTDIQDKDIAERLDRVRCAGIEELCWEAAKEIARLRAFAQWVADHSNDPAVVREANAHLAGDPHRAQRGRGPPAGRGGPEARAAAGFRLSKLPSNDGKERNR